MSKLPSGWAFARLGELGNYINGRAFKPSEWKTQGLPIIRIQNLNDPSAKFNYSARRHEEKYRVQKGDLLIAWSASLGAFIWNGTDAWLNQHIFRVEPNEQIIRKNFLYYAVREAIEELYKKAHGSGMVHVTKPVFEAHAIPIPPRNEQQRIVEKLKKLLGKVDACQKRLEKIPLILKRFRQSVLAAACSGRLTSDWREKNNVSDEFEPTTVETIAEYVGGFAYKSPTFLGNGKNQVIRIGNVRPFVLNLQASPVFIPDEIASATRRFNLLHNDIVISMTGTKYKQDYGYAGIVKETDKNLFLNQRVARLRCGEKVVPLFMLYWLQTDLFRAFFFAGETGNVNQGNVGADGIKKAPIELPSLNEQIEIVRRVEALIKFADQIEARYNKAKAYVDKLAQSILAKAFRGELVPQDPNDEPASVLLERIRTQRATSETTNKKARPLSKKKKQANLFDQA